MSLRATKPVFRSGVLGLSHVANRGRAPRYLGRRIGSDDCSELIAYRSQTGRARARTRQRRTCRAHSQPGDGVQSEQTRVGAIKLLSVAWDTLKAVAWPAAWLYAAQTVLGTLTDRISQRLANACFLAVHGGAYSSEHLGPLWWASVNPDVTTWASGYNWISYGFMVLAFPISIAVSGVVMLALYRIANDALTGAAPVVPSSASSAAAAASGPTSAGSGPTGPAARSHQPTDSHSTRLPEAGLDSRRAVASPSERPGLPEIPGHPPATRVVIDNAPPAGEQDLGAVGAAAARGPSSHAPAGTESEAPASSNGATPAGREAEGAEAAAIAAPTAAAAAPRADARMPYLPVERTRFWALRYAVTSVREVLQGHARRVYGTVLAVAALERLWLFVSASVVAAPLALPRLLNVQMAISLALFGERGLRAALVESRAAMQGHRRAVGIALGLALLLEAIVSPATMLLTSFLPTRIAFEVPEVVVVTLVAGQLLTFLANQVRVLLPFVVYRLLAPHEPNVARP